MSEITQKLLKLIDEGKTLNDISIELNISNRQIYNIMTQIKNKGIEFKRSYYEDGNIKYSKIQELYTTGITANTTIITDKGSNTFKAIVTSDLHIGNSSQRLDLLDKLYDYCSKESIHNIFITGDLIDGTYNRLPQVMSPYEQVDFVIKNYPFDKNILNFVVLGDHDYSVLAYTGQNFPLALNNYRQDIIPVGYKLGKINIKREQIVLFHQFNSQMKIPVCSDLPKQKTIIFEGHHHHGLCVQQFASNLLIDIPSLSDIHLDKKDSIPSVVLAELKFNNGVCDFVYLKQLLMDKEITPINDICLSFSSCTKNDGNNTCRLFKENKNDEIGPTKTLIK